jgi:hypothetical protein
LITSIQETLRNPKTRSRYDKHLKRGFPVWRGNDFYSSIWEPGLFTVLLFVLFFISVAQYFTFLIFYRRDLVRYNVKKQEHEERFKSMTPSQIMKELKKDGGPVSKKDLKKLNPQDMIPSFDEVEPEMVKILDLAIFSLPKLVFEKIVSFGGKSPQKKQHVD